MSEREAIFRKVSLERLSSPERLDMLVHVITARAWLVWATLAGIMVVALLWGFMGRVQTVVSGRAILLQQGGLAEVASAAQGRVLTVRVAIGDRVEEGQNVAEIAQPELVERQRQAEERLAELKASEARARSLLDQELALGEVSLSHQRRLLSRQLEGAHARAGILQERVISQQELLEQGLITRQALLGTQNDLTAAKLEAESLAGQIKELDLKRLASTRQAEAELGRIVSQVAEARRQLEGIVDAARLTTTVQSPYAGRVVEIKLASGALVSPGTPLLTVEADEGRNKLLEAAIFIPAVDGKRIRPGMTVQVMPSTIRREDFGYMIGEVVFVSDYPATAQSMTATLHNEELVRELSGASSPIEVRARLVRADNQSGYRWSTPEGPPVSVSAGTLARADIVTLTQRPVSLVIPALRNLLRID